MADITTVQDYLIVQPTTPSNPNWKLEKTISATATELIVNFEPLDEDGASITKDFLIGIETGGYVETMLVTSVSTTTLTVVRGLALAGLDFTGDSSNGVIHRTGTKIFTNIPAPLLDMALQALRGVISSDVKFATRPTFDTSGVNAVPVFADATARDAALTSPAEGDRCRVTALGAQEYDGSAWVTFGVSTPVTASLGCEKVGQDIRLDLATGSGLELVSDELKIIPGIVQIYSGSSAPSGWLLCDGSAVSRTTYSSLFAVTSTTYGVGDGSTTFNLPDLQGKLPVGKDGATFTDIGDTGGEETHVLTEAELASHTHDIAYATAVGSTSPLIQTSTGTTSAITSTSAGSDAAHNNLQPYLVMNYIIKI